jgi:hypothetical protein
MCSQEVAMHFLRLAGRQVWWTQNNCELLWPFEVDTWEGGGDRKMITQRENTILSLYYTTWNRFRLQKYRNGGQLSSKRFYLHYACSDCWSSRSLLLFPSFFPSYCDVFYALSCFASTIASMLLDFPLCCHQHIQTTRSTRIYYHIWWF